MKKKLTAKELLDEKIRYDTQSEDYDKAITDELEAEYNACCNDSYDDSEFEDD
jgi:hypothetical protein